MAFVSNDQTPEEEKQDQPGTPQGGISPVGGGSAVRLSPSGGVGSVGGGGTSAGSGGTPAAGSTPAPATGGQFGSLNQYLTANQGQAEPLAGKLTAGIGQQYNTLQGQNTSTINDINSQVSAGATPSNANDIIAQESANPSSFTSTPSNVASFQGLLNASYGGPTSAEGTTGYANQQSNINNAIAAGQAATTTEAGRENLLSSQESAPTTGVTALNSAILSQSPTALNSVESAYQPFNNLLTGLSAGAADTDKQIAAQQAQAAQDIAASTGAINSQIGALNTGVTGELTTAQQNAAAQNAQVKKDLAAGTPTVSDLASLGMTSDQWNALSAADKAAATSQVVSSNQGQFNANSGTTTIDPTQFLTQQDPNAAINAANVATPQDYANAQAFQTLLQGMNTQAPAMVINPSTATQAGTAPTNLNSYNYGTALNTANATIADEKAAAQAYVDALQSGADEAHAQAAAKTAAQQAAVQGGIALTGLVNLAGEGIGSGIYNSITGDISNPSLANTADIVNSILGPKLAVNAGKAVVTGLTDAVTTISNIFCFHPDTQIEMANGGTKSICKIQIGDETKGGLVLATLRGMATEFYWYGGVLVTGKHAVKEDGKWVRVEDSREGRRFKYLTEVVCNLVTDQHRIWANGIEFADFYENDNYENLNLRDSIDQLNQGEAA